MNLKSLTCSNPKGVVAIPVQIADPKLKIAVEGINPPWTTGYAASSDNLFPALLPDCPDCPAGKSHET